MRKCVSVCLDWRIFAEVVVGTGMRGSRRARVSGGERVSGFGREQAPGVVRDDRFDALAQT